MSFFKVKTKATRVAARFLICFVFVLFLIPSSGQSSGAAAPATMMVSEAWLDRIVEAKNTTIINGLVYYISFKGLKTHPFYQSPESERSFVWYDNDLYENVDLLYDTYGDILVLKYLNPNGAFFIKLDKNRVQAFDLHHHHFKKLDDGVNGKVGTYFDVLFEMPQFAVVARRRKIEHLESRKRDYLEADDFYIIDNDRWIRITGKGSFSKTLPKDKKKELNNFMKSNRINLRKRKDEDLNKMGAFCYSLKERK